MAERMLGLVRQAAPVLFERCGPSCIAAACPEGKLSCGRLREVRAAYRGWGGGEPQPRLASPDEGAE